MQPLQSVMSYSGYAAAARALTKHLWCASDRSVQDSPSPTACITCLQQLAKAMWHPAAGQEPAKVHVHLFERHLHLKLSSLLLATYACIDQHALEASAGQESKAGSVTAWV